jgi:glycosyltransferase involved in cell wall biosynthesis
MLGGRNVRLLLSTDVTTRGGVDRYVIDLAAAMRAAGHQPVLAVEETTTSPLRDAAGAVAGLRVHRVAMHHRRHPRAHLEHSARALLAELGVDGLHVACGSPRSCLVLREAAVQLALPTVIAEQQIRDNPELSTDDVRRIQDTYRAANSVIFVSEGNRASMAGAVALDGVRHLVIPNGVDVADVRRRTQRNGRGHVAGRVMTAARFAAEKGLDTLVRAASMLPDFLVADVNLFGDGDERTALEKHIADLGVQGRVSLRPWAADVPEQMAEHDLFVLPSLAEGMPYVLLEAMAAGIPIVASDVPGNVEALDGGRAGRIFPRGDAAALAAAIRRRFTDPDETRELTRRARERVAALYDVSHQMRRTVSLWQRAG